MAIRLALPVALLTLAACSSPEEIGAEVGVEAQASTGAVAKAEAASADGARSVKEETDLYQFEQSWPGEVGAIPALAAKLDADGKESRKQLIAEAEEDRRMAEEGDFPYRAHSYAETWKLVADLPGWLSLTEDFYAYSGGAHGNYGLESLVWDKQEETAMSGAEMFASPAVLQSALGSRMCDALDAERLEKRGTDYVSNGIDEFDQCPGVDEATVIVGSSNGKTFDRVGIWFGPYVAGPYAEGAYELNFAVDAKVLDAVKPAYRSAFSIKR